MALPSASADGTRIYNEDLVATLEHVVSGITENAVNAHPGMALLFGNIGAIMRGEIGSTGAAGTPQSTTGESVRVNVKLGQNPTARRLASGYSAFSTDTSDTARGGRANWALYGASVIISGSQKRRNSGAEQFVDQVMYKAEDAVTSLVDLVAEDVLATSPAANSITSIDDIISSADTLQSLNGSTFSNWNSRGLQDKGTAVASIDFTPSTTSFASAGLSNWRTAYMNAEEGRVKPNAIITTDAIFRYYEGSLTPQVRFRDERIGDLSFEGLQFKGATVYHDPFCASGYTYFINTDHLMAKYLPGALFNVSPMIEQEQQDVFSAKVIFEGQLCTDGRKYLNKIDGQTA